MSNKMTKVPLTLYNSYSRALEVFEPLASDQVRMYSCGPTVYNYAHIGNLRAYVFTDVLRRTLQWKGYNVLHVMNITDVGHLTSDQDEGEDKIEVAAKAASKSAWDIAAHYTRAFKRDLDQLSIIPPSLFCVATDHIQDMIRYAATIAEGGYAYELAEGLYFDTTRVPNYGWLARSDIKGQEPGARVQGPEGKRNPSDFALWRKSKSDESRQMEWESPWGAGAPGWHLECSVMSMKYLGLQFDIHTGGIDHREIHHCNEIAQNQAFTRSGNTGARFWMHNAFVTDRSQKMSKSSGRFATLANLTEHGIHPAAFRLLCLSAHYRNHLDFSFDSAVASLTRLKRVLKRTEEIRRREGTADSWRRVVAELKYSRGASFALQRARLESTLPAAGRKYIERFDAELSNDLSTPTALTLLDEVAFHKSLDAETQMRILECFDLVMGLGIMRTTLRELNVKPVSCDLTPDDISAALEMRAQFRADKRYDKADAIRRQLESRGIEIMDGEPVAWNYKPKDWDRDV